MTSCDPRAGTSVQQLVQISTKQQLADLLVILHKQDQDLSL